jgi:hypothetical protein
VESPGENPPPDAPNEGATGPEVPDPADAPDPAERPSPEDPNESAPGHNPERERSE